MNILKATKRSITSSGKVNKLRSEGFIPAILYGGKKNNLSISLKKLHLQDLVRTETFMSEVVDLEIDGNTEKVLPKDIAYDPVSDEPLHIDFMRIVKGSRLILEIPVKFINSEKSPGLKKGGVLNIVRRKVQLKCPAENIPNEIVVDLDNTEINSSLKISSVKLPENVIPTVEPEKTEETAAEEKVPAEDAAEDTTTTEGDKDKTIKPSDDKAKVMSGDKGKSAKPSDDKAKAVSDNKGKPADKEKEIKKK